jgi:hypothetical protein
MGAVAVAADAAPFPPAPFWTALFALVVGVTEGPAWAPAADDALLVPPAPARGAPTWVPGADEAAVDRDAPLRRWRPRAALLASTTMATTTTTTTNFLGALDTGASSKRRPECVGIGRPVRLTRRPF